VLGVFYEGDTFYFVFLPVDHEFFPRAVEAVIFLEGLSLEEFAVDISEMCTCDVVHVSSLSAKISFLAGKSMFF